MKERLVVVGNIKTVVQGKETIIDGDKYESIDTDNLDEDLKMHSAYYAYLGTILAARETLLEKTEDEFKDKEIELYGKQMEVLEERAKTSKEKITENKIYAWVRVQVEYLDLRDKLYPLREEVRKLKALCRGMEHRKDMLVQLNSTKKEEMRLDGR